jgi:histidine ammonia-lyase
MEFLLKPGQLTYQDIKLLLDETTTIKLDPASHAAIHASAEVVKKIIAHKKPTYGINTGFGALANVQIDHAQLETLQKHLLLSHACGTGELLTDDIVRLMLALKINALARGFSGVRLTTIELLIRLFNAKIYPCVPAKGSVGASGDLAPLAHLHLILLGVGHAHHQGKTLSAKEA